jgi:hypothetical protein
MHPVRLPAMHSVPLLARFSFPLACIAAILSLSQVQAAEPGTAPALGSVTDYYLALPQEILGVGGPSPVERRKLIDTEDLKNGYLHLSSGDWEGFGEIVLWRRPDKTYLLGVGLAHCGPECGQHLRFFEHREDGFHEVTDQVWSPLSEADISARFEKVTGKKYADGGAPPTLVKLPRTGTSLSLQTQEAFTGGLHTLATWTFQGGKFVLQPGP